MLDYLPRKALLKAAEVDALQAAGIDLTDQQAIDAWVAEFNARPRHERDAITGASPFLDDSDPAT